MACPELLVDQRDEMADLRTLIGRHTHVECRGDVETRQVLPPVQRNLMVAPFARNADRQLVFMAAFINPVTKRSHLFQKVQRIGIEFLGFNKRSGH